MTSREIVEGLRFSAVAIARMLIWLTNQLVSPRAQTVSEQATAIRSWGLCMVSLNIVVVRVFRRDIPSSLKPVSSS